MFVLRIKMAEREVGRLQKAIDIDCNDAKNMKNSDHWVENCEI